MILDEEKQKRLINGMLLYVMAGDLQTRLQYTGILLGRVRHFILEKARKDQSSARFVQSAIQNTFRHEIMAHVIRRSIFDHRDPNPKTLTALIEEFGRHAIKIDSKWTEPGPLFAVQIAREMAALKHAQALFERSLEAFTMLKYGSNNAYSVASADINTAINILADICYENSLVEFSDREFSKSAASAKPPAPPDREPPSAGGE